MIEPSTIASVATPPVVLTIAGSDSGGGAGIQADLKTFGALRTIGTSAITAVTAQNTVGVSASHVLPLEIIEMQIRAVLEDLEPKSVKTGMLATAGIVDVVYGFAENGSLPNLVVDPVMVATSGDTLLTGPDPQTHFQRLFRYAEVITPNAIEAGILCERQLHTITDLHDAAKQLGERGAKTVVVKGGHIAGPQSTDVVWDGEQSVELASPRLDTVNTHGTGCSFAAAIAAELAKGSPTIDAVISAKRYITDAVAGAQSWKIGKGHGPVDHRGPATFRRFY